MNADTLKGKWKQIQGDIKQRWGKLTDDDLTYIDGTLDKLVGKLQERYGQSRERAHEECQAFMKKFEQAKVQKASS